MPELPEVECVRLGIESVIGAQVKDVEWNYPPLWDKETLSPNHLKNQFLVDTHRKGKYLILEFSDSQLLLHLGMSGVFLLQHQSQERRPHTHLVVQLKGKPFKESVKVDNQDLQNFDGWELRYSDPRKFGHLHLEQNPSKEKAQIGTIFKRWKKLGPDALERAFNKKYFFEKCQKSHREIKIFLLDQKVVAGVGNIYASEALFRAKILPTRSANSLSLEECDLLVKASKFIMKKSIEQRGTTFSDYRLTNGKGGSFQGFLKVFQKEGEFCPSCKSHEILKISQDNRSTFYCLNCQI